MDPALIVPVELAAGIVPFQLVGLTDEQMKDYCMFNQPYIEMHHTHTGYVIAVPILPQ